MSLILSGTTGVADVDGSAATPAIRGTDANTGIFFPAADTIGFAEGGVEAMRIDSSGNVGIGVTSPTNKLQVAGALSVTGTLGSIATSSLVIESDSANSRARFITAGSNSSTYSNTVFASTYSDGSGYTERMRINSSGVLLVGTTTTVDGCLGLSMDSGTNTWQVGPAASSGVTQFYITKKASGAGVYLTSTSATSWSSASDINLKNITGKIENALNAVSALTPARYTWKADETNTPQVGLIAQEIQKVLPEVIGTDINGNLSIRYTEVIPLLVGAIQEQQALIQDLTTRLVALEAK